MGVVALDRDASTAPDIEDIEALNPSNFDVLQYRTGGTRYNGVQPSALSTMSSIGYVLRPLADRGSDYVNAKDYGCLFDGSGDTVAQWITGGTHASKVNGGAGYANLAAIQVDFPHVTSTSDSIDWAGLQAAVNADLGNVVCSFGVAILTDVITNANDGCKILGYGSPGFSTSEPGTTLRASHRNGAVVWNKGKFSGCSDMLIDSTSARNTTYLASCRGIRHEPVDSSGAAALYGSYGGIQIEDQPGDGIIFVGFCGLALSCFFIRRCLGHGINLDNGTATSRTNKSPAGYITIRDGAVQDCLGHSIKGGGLNESANAPFRIIMDNLDLTRCACYSGGPRVSAHNLYFIGTSSVLQNSAMSGSAGGSVGQAPWDGTGSVHLGDSNATTSAIFMLGINNRISNIRAVNVLTSVIEIGHSVSELFTSNIVVEDIFVIDSTNNPGEQLDLNPAVLVAVGATRISVRRVYTRFVTTVIRNTDGTYPAGTVTETVTVPKLADEARQSLTTNTADTHLIVPVYAYEKLRFEAEVLFSGDAGVDLKITFNGPSGSTLTFGARGGQRYDQSDTLVSDTPNSAGSSKVWGTATTVRLASIVGYLEVGANAGSLSLLWAQLVSTASDLTIHEGSWLKVMRE